MNAIATLPVVRVRVSCANAQEYRRARAPDFAARGVFVPSARMRPVGARVRLRIELLDRSFGHDGEAVVSRHLRTGPRPGYFLKLGGGVDERSDAGPRRRAPDPATSPTESTPEPVGLGAPAVERTPDPVALAEFLFADLNLAEVAPPAGPLVGADLLELRPRPRLRVRETPRPAPAPARPPGPPPLPAPPAVHPTPPVPAPPVRAAVPAPAARPEPPAPGLPPLHLTFDADDAPTPPFHAAAAARLRGLRRVAPVLAAVLLGGALSGGGLLLAGPTRAEARAADLAAELRRADAQLRAGRLADAGNDSALDHLVAARGLVPGDPRVTRRLRLLADLFGELGERAAARGDLEEARAHFQARVRAEPGDETFKQRLREVTGRVASGSPAAARGARADARTGARAR